MDQTPALPSLKSSNHFPSRVNDQVVSTVGDFISLDAILPLALVSSHFLRHSLTLHEATEKVEGKYKELCFIGEIRVGDRVTFEVNSLALWYLGKVLKARPDLCRYAQLALNGEPIPMIKKSCFLARLIIKAVANPSETLHPSLYAAALFSAQREPKILSSLSQIASSCPWNGKDPTYLLASQLIFGYHLDSREWVNGFVHAVLGGHAEIAKKLKMRNPRTSANIEDELFIPDGHHSTVISLLHSDLTLIYSSVKRLAREGNEEVLFELLNALQHEGKLDFAAYTAKALEGALKGGHLTLFEKMTQSKNTFHVLIESRFLFTLAAELGAKRVVIETLQRSQNPYFPSIWAIIGGAKKGDQEFVSTLLDLFPQKSALTWRREILLAIINGSRKLPKEFLRSLTLKFLSIPGITDILVTDVAAAIFLLIEEEEFESAKMLFSVWENAIIEEKSFKSLTLCYPASQENMFYPVLKESDLIKAFEKVKQSGDADFSGQLRLAL